MPSIAFCSLKVPQKCVGGRGSDLDPTGSFVVPQTPYSYSGERKWREYEGKGWKRKEEVEKEGVSKGEEGGRKGEEGKARTKGQKKGSKGRREGKGSGVGKGKTCSPPSNPVSTDAVKYTFGEQEAQLMLTTGSTRLAISRGQQTWYHFGFIASFR